jgi:hypothetical protein
MQPVRCVIAIAAALAAAPAPARADDKPALAVLGVVARDPGLTKAAGTMTAAIRTQAGAKASRYRVVGTPKQIDAAVLAAECSAIEPACAAALGAGLAADYTIAGELERRGTHQVLVMALVDVDTKRRIRSVREIGATRGDAKKLLRAAYARLVHAEAGELRLVANAPDGDVLVDGQVVGGLFEGRATISGLVNGTHQLAIRARGFRPFEIEITIDFATTQMVLLDPE